ncbi:MAG: alpha/beta family hydrolase [Clostridium cadaveris]|uniref:Alpha/beta hydrolase n=1 Tax=Clostridium cadaveris TaxID=1529 RepID=A0A316M224_9CLOT|nr:alpha/beta family hydrolase [Clostridium cadaveris]MDY4948561.1 alpha/beta family hydrolase [Clostridium cadaveris]PWL52552.1 MAG: alpha/beta hydrolase [Clostridium cadaveris]UFH63647.1 alpha/beta hydrolase [Clostridium cadaveris]
MNNKLTKSYWGVESNGKFTDNNSKTLSIILPGIGYLLDRSYLDYSKQLCLQMGYDVLEIEYGFHITRAKFDPSKEFDILVSETINVIERSIIKDYDNIIIIGKSIGTCVQIMVNKHFRDKITKNIYISPIDKTVSLGITTNSLIITGSADPLLNSNNLTNIKETNGSNLLFIENANHALDIKDDVIKTIDALKEVLQAEKDFLEK